MSATNDKRLLRSNCRSHGTGSCTCPTHELPMTPRRSRSSSRTPSRSSSVAPELTFHSSSEVISMVPNGTIQESYFSSAHQHQQQQHSTSTDLHYNARSHHFEESLTQSSRRSQRTENKVLTRSSRTLAEENHAEDYNYQERLMSSRLGGGGGRSIIMEEDTDDGLSYLKHRTTTTGSQNGSIKSSSSGLLSSLSNRGDSGGQRSASVQRMIRVYNEEEAEGLDGKLNDSTSTLENGSMAHSYNSSFGSSSRVSTTTTKVMTSAQHRSAASTTSSSTISSTKLRNGNHHSVSQHENSRRLISVLRSADADSSGIALGSGHDSYSYTGSAGSLLTRIKDSAWSSRIQTRTTAGLTYAQNALLYVPRLIYWGLVNLFVCEKWILHQRVSSSTVASWCNRLLLLLGLLFLLGGTYSYFGPISSLVGSATRGGFFATVPPHHATEDSFSSPGTVLPAATKCCEVPPNPQVEKLLERIAVLERSQEAIRLSAKEDYSRQLAALRADIELKLKEEVQKIEPTTTTVVVEKETVIKSEPPPPPVEPKPIDFDEIIGVLMPKILPMVLGKINAEKEAAEEAAKATVVTVETTPAIEPEPLDIDKITTMLMPTILPLIMDRVKGQVEALTLEKECPEKEIVTSSEPPVAVPLPSGFDLKGIEKLIRAAILKYDADKTGLPDLALEPAGGSILSTRCTKSSQSKNSVLTLWGWRVWSFSNSPRSIIQPGVVPGECWVVEGATAEVVIQLISPAIITGFTLEHIPKSISPYGKIDTAPKKFQVVGLMYENDMDTIWDYGTFEYLDNDEPAQYFAVQNKTDTPYPIVELKVLSNHGSVKSTCIYRFRVHGEKIDIKH